MSKKFNVSVKTNYQSLTSLRRKFLSGFTLVELLVVLTLAAILLGLAVPSFSRLIKSTTISSNVNNFMADLRFARSEAVRVGGAVVMCRSDAPEATNPTCGTGSGLNNTGWVSGWIIFQDLNNNGSKVAAEPLLRVQAPIASMDSIGYEASVSTKIRFTATGRLINLSSGAGQLQFGGNDNYSNDLQRVVCINLSGRARIAGDGTTSCDSDS